MNKDKLEKVYKIFLKNGQGISTDTRTIKKRDIFFALKGENFNGNLYIKQALKSGAALCVCDDNNVKESSKIIKVSNSLNALQSLAKHHRKNLTIPVIGLTGSNGKTTTKELIFSVLKQKYKVQKTEGNFNNHIGVPLTVLSIKPETEIAIVEMGANHIHEIGELCKISKPTHGLVTNVSPAHIGEFGSFENIKVTKFELYDSIEQSLGVAFYNPKNKMISQKVSTLKSVQKIKYSESSEIKNKSYTLSVEINKEEINSNLNGSYNKENIECAYTIGQFFMVPDKKIIKGIETYKPKNHRSQIRKTRSGNKLVIDCYNANPESMELSIKNFFDKTKKGILILGGMKELGKDTDKYHKKVISLISKNKHKKVFLVGSEYKTKKYPIFDSSEDLKTHLSKNKIKNSEVLLKGSRGSSLEKVIDVL